MLGPVALVDRYVAVWQESDPATRRASVTELWASDGVHVLMPPQEVVAQADDLGLVPTFQASGHDELEVRGTYEEFVADGTFTFRRRGDVARVRDAVKFTWEMVDVSGAVADVGTEVLLLDADGRIRTDYQFIEPMSLVVVRRVHALQ